MANYRGPVCRLCRRNSQKLFLKGIKCTTHCTLDKKSRAKPPGQHGDKRMRVSEYSRQLREKQKVRRIYMVQERQFRRYFAEAERQKGMTGENLLVLLERRLDSIVHRLGFASSMRSARQLVRNGHILVNDKRVNIPSYLIKEGETVTLKEKSRENVEIKKSLTETTQAGYPEWIEFRPENFSGRILRLPTRDQIPVAVEEHLIVEFYSR
ncbi:MAG: 30S ribosomal protein S4 [Elusimicrobiota bacterium]